MTAGQFSTLNYDTESHFSTGSKFNVTPAAIVRTSYEGHPISNANPPIFSTQIDQSQFHL